MTICCSDLRVFEESSGLPIIRDNHQSYTKHHGKAKQRTNIKSFPTRTSTGSGGSICWGDIWNRPCYTQAIRQEHQRRQSIYHWTLSRKGVSYYRCSETHQSDGHVRLHRRAVFPRQRSRSDKRADQEVRGSYRHPLHESWISQSRWSKRCVSPLPPPPPPQH